MRRVDREMEESKLLNSLLGLVSLSFSTAKLNIVHARSLPPDSAGSMCGSMCVCAI